MKLRIVSDGTGQGTRVETEDGQLIKGVTYCRFEVVSRGFVRVDLHLEGVHVDVVVDRKQVFVKGLEYGQGLVESDVG